MSTLLTVTELHKSFGLRAVLDGVSFTVNQGDRIGLVGVNGSGKSTLMRVVVSLGLSDDPALLPDAGTITRSRGLTLTYVPQEPVFAPHQTVAEALREGQEAHREVVAELAELEAGLDALTGRALNDAIQQQAELHESLVRLGGWEVEHEVRELHAALHLPPLDAELGVLSGGERRRVAIARALLGHPDLLALDEPTNHLDAAAIGWLEAALPSRVDALLLVTHDRAFLDAVCTRILELDRGKLHAYVGNYKAFLEAQADRLANEQAQEDKRASFVRNELDWIRRGPAARTTKQQARIDRFDAAVDAKPDSSQAAPGQRAVRLELPPGPRLGKTILDLEDVTIEIGGRTLVDGLTLRLKPGDRIGIVGPNGAGKTTLVRTLMGDRAPKKGTVTVGVNTQFAFLDQGRTLLHDDRTVLEEVSGDHEWVELASGPVHVRTFLRMLLFDDRAANVKIGNLSGGERNRVLLARLLRLGGNVLVLDEPTNDLDLITLSVLEDALVRFGGCALVVSHDRWFLDKVATGILAFEGDGSVVFYEGSYSAWRARSSTSGKAGSNRAVPLAAPVIAAPAAPGRKLTYKEKRELEGMEAAIGVAEASSSALAARMADPATYKLPPEELRELAAKAEAAAHVVERLYARWQELEALG